MRNQLLHALAAAILIAGTGTTAYADSYKFHYSMGGMKPKPIWVEAEPLISDWENVGGVYGCETWTPDPATVTIGVSFLQSSIDCKQDQTRNVQYQEYEVNSGEVRLVGEAITEHQTVSASSSRPAVGTKETWGLAEPSYTDWVNTGAVTSCSNWSPAPETVTIGQAFTQKATDCKQVQTRTRQDREYEPTLGQYRDIGNPVTESQTVTVESTRSATGTKETWVAVSPHTTDWVNSGGLTGCSNWSPAASTVTAGQTFTQTATDCKQVQTRTRQDQEQETTTKAYRNVGSPVTETRTLTGLESTRSATGTMVPAPKITGLSAYSTYNRGTCQSTSHISWQHSNVVRQTLKVSSRTYNLTTETSKSTDSAGNITLTACNAAGQCVTATSYVKHATGHCK